MTHQIRVIISLFCISICSFTSLTAKGEVTSDSLEILHKIVMINSHSLNISGINQVRKTLIPLFEKLGFTAHYHELAQHHLLTSLDFPDEKPEVALIGHLDTVFPASAQSGETRVEENRIYGPGIIDMKGGLIVILKTVERLTLNERRRIKIILNDDEELASIYSRDKIREITTAIPSGLVFEPGLPDGSLVTSASGGRWIKLSVKGKAAHAGLEHHKGLNACTELSHQLTELHQLTDYQKKLTLNIGVIQGGTQPNVVCEAASATLDVRYVNPADLEGLLKKIEKISNQTHIRNIPFNLTPTSSLETLAIVPSMPESSTRILFDLAQEVGEKIHQNIHGQHVGYATDGNHLVQTGMQLLVGLGPYGGGMHTADEFMQRESLDGRILLSIHLIQAILKQKALSPTLPRSALHEHNLHTRVRGFSEVMFPSLGNGDRFVPKPTGEPFVPAFFAGQLGVDLEFIPNFRIFYLQKGLAIFPAIEGANPNGRFLDPRLGLRKIEMFSIPNLMTEYDFFVQPGLARAFINQPNRLFDLGIRLSNRYRLPSSNWTFGGNFEFLTTFFKESSHSANLSGLVSIFASYQISRFFATQHWLYSFYKHQTGDPFYKFSWDITGMPYFQNGISFNTTKETTISILLNHYALRLPSFQTMWISLWTSFAFDYR